jgi:hypothetical protein
MQADGPIQSMQHQLIQCGKNAKGPEIDTRSRDHLVKSRGIQSSGSPRGIIETGAGKLHTKKLVCSKLFSCPGITWYHHFKLISPRRDAYATTHSANHVTKLTDKTCRSGRSSNPWAHTTRPCSFNWPVQKEQAGIGLCSTMRQFILQESSLPGNRIMVEVVVLQQESGQPAAYQRVRSTAAHQERSQ